MTSNSPSGFRKLDGVSSEIAKVLARKGITVPTPVQAEVIPAAMRGGDILAQAPTGSGKTLAFGIPIIARMPDRVSAPLALILVPTRELAVQVADELRHCATTRGFKVAAVFGGANIMAQTSQSKHAAIIVATPGRFDDMMRKSLIKVSRIRTVVLDEADRMLDMGFQPQVDRILERLPQERQTLLFSATLSGAMRSTIDGYVNNPFVVQVAGFEPMDMGGIDHNFTTTSNPQRMDTLIELLNSTKRDLAAVFVRTKRGADRLDKKLRSAGVRSTAIHGGMTQSARLRELKRFSTGQADTIIATDVFARGIDVDRITHVINFDPPEDSDTYKHRVGRTGRAGRTGVAISLVSPEQRKFYQGVAKNVGIDATVIGGRPGRRAEERNAAELRTTGGGTGNGGGANAPRTGGSNMSAGNSKPKKVQAPRPERHEAPSRVERFESASTDPRNIKPVNLDRPAGPSRKDRHPERGQVHRNPFANDRSPAVQEWSGKPGTSRPDAGNSTADYEAKAGSTQGVVKWFADRKGFGFIERLVGDDLFVHQSSIEMRGRRTLEEGQMVSFETGPGKRGEEARNVKLLAGSAPNR